MTGRKVVVALCCLMAGLVALGTGPDIFSRATIIERDGSGGKASSGPSSADDAETGGKDEGGSAPETAEQDEESGSDGSASSGNASGMAGRVLVDVDGQVAAPGVYELSGSDPRVRDAVAAAGGLLDTADSAALNLASKVADGAKIHVPAAGEEPRAASDGAGTVSGAGTGGARTSGTASGTGTININTATAEELKELPGVGDATAQAIIEEREAAGPFTSIEDLMRVSGIGEKKFARLKGSICV